MPPPPSPPLLAAIRQPALLYGPDGTVFAANGPAEALAGRPLDGLRPEDVAIALSLRRRRGAISGRDEHPVARALAGEAVVDIPLSLTAADGRTVQIIGTVTPVLDGGQVTGALAIWTDMTPLAEAEAALREREATYRTIIETANEGIWEMDERFVTLQVNSTMAAMLGYRPEEMVGRPVPEFLFAEDIPEHVPRQDDRSRGLRGRYECRLKHRDGSERWALVSATPKTDGAGAYAGSFAMFVDITERRRAEVALRTYADELRRSNEELQRFAYVASHDLQEPLRSIISFSQLLARRYRGRLDADADDYIGFIVEGGNRMQRLILDLLQLSRVETQAKPLRPTDAATVASSVLRAMETRLAEAGATVTVDDLPVVMADEAQLVQVVANLVGNAVKYGRRGVPPEVCISAGRRGDLWEFAVADNGIGIEAEYYDRIFEMFRRLHTHDKYEGTGIGLAVVKRIVERHGGTVRVESVPGEGSTFVFTLPAA